MQIGHFPKQHRLQQTVPVYFEKQHTLMQMGHLPGTVETQTPADRILQRAAQDYANGILQRAAKAYADGIL
jgi:hypothetical protein